jgi:molybdenum cofactor cytidylyltransferase
MPGIRAAFIDLLLEQYLASGASLGAFRAADRPIHPVVFGRRFYPELLRLQGDQGARHLFQRHQDQACWVSPPEGYVDSDVDTPADYERLQRDFAGKQDIRQ